MVVAFIAVAVAFVAVRAALHTRRNVKVLKKDKVVQIRRPEEPHYHNHHVSEVEEDAA
jgi:hypothetical protein